MEILSLFLPRDAMYKLWLCGCAVFAWYNLSVQSNQNVQSKRKCVQSKMQADFGILGVWPLKWRIHHSGVFHFQFFPVILNLMIYGMIRVGKKYLVGLALRHCKAASLVRSRWQNMRFRPATHPPHTLPDSTPRRSDPRYDTIRYDSVCLTCSKKLTGSQLNLPHGTNKKLKCKTKN